MRFASIAALILSIASAIQAEELPRYRLPVGRKLTYSMHDETTNLKSNKKSVDDGIWVFTVARENPDGSRAHDAQLGNDEDGDVKYFDMFDDGRMLANETLGPWFIVGRLIPLLPKDEAELSKGWKQSAEAMGETISYTPQNGGAELIFSSIQEGMISKLYESTSSGTFHFDREKGAVVKKETASSQGYGFVTKSAGVIKLEKDETIPAAEAAQLASDFEIAFAAKNKHQDLMVTVDKADDRADAVAAEAKAALTAAQSQVKSKEAGNLLAKSLKSHDSWAKSAKEDAVQLAKVLNKPSEDWSTTDIDGKPVKLSDFKGKVVVMDFWYRGCGWCMVAMPQVKQLSDDYKDKGVVVLGMNTDKDEKDARVVIDALGLNYPTIKATDIPKIYGINGFPTLVIVDQSGVVRDLHVGYSSTLRTDIGKAVDKLLAKPVLSSTGRP